MSGGGTPSVGVTVLAARVAVRLALLAWHSKSARMRVLLHDDA